MAATLGGVRRVRTVTAGVLTLMPFVAIVATWLLWRGSLPEALPTQWSGDTIATTQPTFVLLGITAVTAVVTGAFGLTSGLTRTAHFTPRLPLLVTGIVGSLCFIMWTTSAALGAAAASQPVLENLGVVIWGAITFGFLPAIIAGKPARPDAEGQPDPLVLSPTQTAAWSHTMTVPAFAWTAVGIFAVGTVSLWVPLASPNPGVAIVSSAVVLAVVVLLMVAMSRVRITADGRGLRMRSQLLPFVAKSIRLSQIKKVRTEAVNPGAWGGWGYRVLPGRSAVVLRAGEGVVLTLNNGKEFAVTVDDSSNLASVLGGLSATPVEENE
ncbi:hypothetical protein E3T39_12780 [Cryobacterium suzukii]|uniref:DUF1648 domain-containing protein n=1 Tax=Cryobacterium suzukii TaxID=1259198 RepID=A0A4R9ACL1_9MICO|nr:hypothetical protein [Cryobacterium suzukii]TFD57660.1 hypothetical protein E3T39_12780 [Cryobacterium suzukii]